MTEHVAETQDQKVPLLEARELKKSFARVQALSGADFCVYEGEVVALVGDNGAGKSTLVETLTGNLRPDSGEILWKGEPIELHHPRDAQALGIEILHQDLALAPDLDPAANVYLGRELLRKGPLGRLGFLDKAEMRRRAAGRFDLLGVRLQSSTVPVVGLSGGQKQGVALARSAMWASELLLLDEPTAALGVTQRNYVMELIRRVRDLGVSVVLITHNLPEVFAVADRVEVLRHGRRVTSFLAAEASMEDIVRAMTGAMEGSTL